LLPRNHPGLTPSFFKRTYYTSRKYLRCYRVSPFNTITLQ